MKLGRKDRLNKLFAAAPEFLVTPLLMGPVYPN